jgi:hypothetical protein
MSGNNAINVPIEGEFAQFEANDPYLSKTWVPCDNCDDFWCVLHQEHVYDCSCPGLHGDDDA